MDINWNHELIEQLDWHWHNHFRPGLKGLTDDEFLWEPVAGWSLRPRDQARSALAAGADTSVADYEYPEPVPAPFTTIAWRMGHIAIGVLGERAANHFGSGGVDYSTTDWPLTAAGGLILLDGRYDAWITGLRGLDLAGLSRPCGPVEGPFADYPFGALILHISREVIHHGAEIRVLRDLYIRRDELSVAGTRRN